MNVKMHVDAERIKKRAAMTNQSQALTKSIFLDETECSLINSNDDLSISLKKDFAIIQYLLLLEQSKWLTPSAETSHAILDENSLPVVTDVLIKKWAKAIKLHEQSLAYQRRNKADISTQTLGNAPETEIVESLMTTNNTTVDIPCPKTDTLNVSPSVSYQNMAPDEIVNHIHTNLQLNQKQGFAFWIIANHFLQNGTTSVGSATQSEEPIHLLLTGPGGTGKTHVVKALKEVMSNCGCGHMIRFLAPTGSTASLIDGLTIHKGLGIKIQKNDKGKGNRVPGDSCEDYSVLISIHNHTLLHDEWHMVKFLLIDEISLVSEQLLCEVDHALRYATERPNDWFGGISMIFAGDFFQYPPIGGTPLYMSIPHYSSKYKNDIPR